MHDGINRTGVYPPDCLQTEVSLLPRVSQLPRSPLNVVMTSSSPHAASVRFRHFYPAASTVQLLDKQPRARARVGGNVERAVVRWL